MILAKIGQLLFPYRAAPTVDSKYHQAMAMSDDIIEKMRERSASPDPIRALLADMWSQRNDVALVADAFEAMQESRIFKGPPE